ncbi:MAG: hypothetical protein GY679_05450, partial [Mycoplasma sp.]|nr:hypothetical protein [Mycoplasma sp.]
HSNSVNFMDWPYYDFQQNISALDAQLAHLKTSINRQNRARKKGSSPRESSNSDQPAAQPTCTSCDKVGHSKSDRKCPALRSKCHNCQRIGHWSVVCRSPTVTSASLGRAIKSRLKGPFLWAPVFQAQMGRKQKKRQLNQPIPQIGMR